MYVLVIHHSIYISVGPTQAIRLYITICLPTRTPRQAIQCVVFAGSGSVLINGDFILPPDFSNWTLTLRGAASAGRIANGATEPLGLSRPIARLTSAQITSSMSQVISPCVAVNNLPPCEVCRCNVIFVAKCFCWPRMAWLADQRNGMS
jgi:hypothetical protein